MSSIFKLYNGALSKLPAGCLALLAATLSAQTEMSVGVFEGALTARQGTDAGGDIVIRNAQGTDLLCHYDAHSYIERDRFRIPAASVKLGEPVEILADHKPGSQSCYARMLMVINPAAERAKERLRQTMLQPRDPLQPFFFTPAGDRTFSGVVAQVTSRLLMLRTRAGDATLVLRPDTRYIDEGVRAESSELRVNTRVFVRAGRTIDGIVEAYQVIWGNILAVQ